MRKKNKDFYKKQYELVDLSIELLKKAYKELLKEKEFNNKYGELFYNSKIPQFLFQILLVKKNDLEFKSLYFDLIEKTNMTYEQLKKFIHFYGISEVMNKGKDIGEKIKELGFNEVYKNYTKYFKLEYNPSIYEK